MPDIRKPAALLGEPLIQFLLLGGLIFALNAYLGPGAGGADKTPVVVSAQRIAAFQSDFAAREGRQPTAAEIRAYVDNWIDEEVLYRQARALGLDRGDRLIRRHLVQKMRYLIEDAHPLDEPSRAELAEWLHEHPGRYAQPPAVSFEHVFIDRAHADGERRAGELLTRLRAGTLDAARAGDAFPGGAVVGGADPATVAKGFGGAFWDRLEQLPRGEWRGPIRSRLGLHLVRITNRRPSQPATVESAGRQLRIDYRNHRRARVNAEAIKALRARYDIAVERGSG